VKQPNVFEKKHDTLLSDAEAVALEALKEIAAGGNRSSTNEQDVIRMEAAKTILSIRSDDA
jgi:hypothetical protein